MKFCHEKNILQALFGHIGPSKDVTSYKVIDHMADHVLSCLEKWKFSLKNRFFIDYLVENEKNNNPEFVFCDTTMVHENKHKIRAIYKGIK